MRRKRDWFRIRWMAAIGSFGLAFAAGAVAGFASYKAVRGGRPSLIEAAQPVTVLWSPGAGE